MTKGLKFLVTRTWDYSYKNNSQDNNIKIVNRIL